MIGGKHRLGYVSEIYKKIMKRPPLQIARKKKKLEHWDLGLRR